MVLYFTNDSKQNKKLIVSDYAEDIYDVLIGFLEDHRIFPHFLKVSESGVVSWESYSEKFIIEDYSVDDLNELQDLINEN